MRYRAVLIATLVLAACSTSRVTPGESPAVSSALKPVVEFLLTSAATDFHTHRPPDPVRFRDVRLGHLATASGEEQYMLCGQFLPAEGGANAEWTPFATIKTSDYEQWIGGQGAASASNRRSYGTRWAICRPHCRVDSILFARVQDS